MEKHPNTEPSLPFPVIPDKPPESECHGHSAAVEETSSCFASTGTTIPFPPMFHGQTPTAQNLLAALDAQSEPIVVRGIQFITPQPESDESPGDMEKKTGIRMVNQKRYGKAIHALERAIELGQDDYACQMNLGLAYTRVGRLEEAIALLSNLQRLHPQDAGIATLLGKSLLLSGQRQEAVNTMAPVAMTHPERFHLHYYLGIAYAKLDQTRNAMDAWEKASALRPEHKEIKRWLSIGERMLA
ncbi:MAG: tetratricopeptide repeat protein [Nitrospirae bacterium]|nr:tetratricopeptide repeat protein [Magnetococcales bacterium]